MGLFGKVPERSPREQVREWTSKIRKESMQLDRQIRSIKREEDKVKTTLKQAAKKGDKDVCLILAKEIVNSRKAVNRINTSKAQLNSVALHMTQQAAQLRVAGSMQKSGEVMKLMNNLMKVHEISSTMQELSREMMRAGIIEEMMEETMENVTGMDEDEMEEEAQAEVDKVLFELTAGQLGKAPAAVADSLPPQAGASVAVDNEEDEEEIQEMQKRLEALKS
ncbi:Charged multivesicular body protein 3 [Halotydeus destructor]|nr:Charged multivesicular body protein 3 [Halotydeus destructor]